MRKGWSTAAKAVVSPSGRRAGDGDHADSEAMKKGNAVQLRETKAGLDTAVQKAIEIVQ